MVRKEIYFVDDKEVTKDEWELKLKDENNLSTLTVKYEKIQDVDYLLKVIDDLKQELEEERNKNKIDQDWNEIIKDKFKFPSCPYPYPYVTYKDVKLKPIQPDWTYRPENGPFYFTTTSYNA